METTKTTLILFAFLIASSLLIFFFRRRKKQIQKRDELEKQKLEEIYELRKKFIENSRASSELRMSIMHNAQLTKEDVRNLDKILKDEISFLKTLIPIVDEDEWEIAHGKKDTYSKVALAAKELCDERLQNRLKIGLGYTPYYAGSRYSSLILKTLVEYHAISCPNLQNKRLAIAITALQERRLS